MVLALARWLSDLITGLSGHIEEGVMEGGKRRMIEHECTSASIAATSVSSLEFGFVQEACSQNAATPVAVSLPGLKDFVTFYWVIS